MATSSTPRHFYMMTALATYTRKENFRHRHMNVVVESPKRAVTVDALNQAQFELYQRLLKSQAVETVEQIIDFGFISISYLGHMPPEDFRGNRGTPAAPDASDNVVN